MTRIRPITLNDGEVINAVRTRNALPGIDPVEWRKWCLDFPYREEFKEIPIGWILESDTGPVGVLSNVPMLYELDGQPIRAGIADAWAVDPAHRNASLQLMNAYFAQKGIDLHLIGSASPAVSRVLALLRMQCIPAPGYDEPLLWPVRYRTFAAAALRRRGAPVPGVLAWPAGLVLGAAALARRSNGRRLGEVRRSASFDERFDGFWSRIRCGHTRLRAVRTSAVLRWRFQNELQNGSATILVHENGGEVQGYVVLLRRFLAHLRLTMCDVADLQAVDDDPSVLRSLLAAGLRLAKEEGAEGFKFVAGEGAKRAVALSLRPYSYHLDSWQLFYKVREAGLAAALAGPAAWDFSPFDTF